MKKLQFDKISYWTELKLEIIKEYAVPFSTILGAQKNPKISHAYIDAFAGSGINISKSTGLIVAGSPVTALALKPPFDHYYFIDLDQGKSDHLRETIGDRSDVSIHTGDCNRILLTEVFPKVKYEAYRRGLCLLDPYGLDLDWEVISTAGKMRSVEIFLNFPTMAMNRLSLWSSPEKVSQDGLLRMNAFWGDESWREIVYDDSPDLFGQPELQKTATNIEVAKAYQKRLRQVAGFKYVPDPIPMRNSSKSVVYYLFFASNKPVAEKIVIYIFTKYRDRGVR